MTQLELDVLALESKFVRLINRPWKIRVVPEQMTSRGIIGGFIDFDMHHPYGFIQVVWAEDEPHVYMGDEFINEMIPTDRQIPAFKYLLKKYLNIAAPKVKYNYDHNFGRGKG